MKKFINGSNLRVFVGGKVVAAATTCTVTINNVIESADTKDNEGVWDEGEITGKNWSMSVGALMPVGGDNAAADIKDLTAAVLEDSTVEVKFEQTNGAKNRTEVTGEGKDIVSLGGKAFIESLSLNADAKKNASYTANLKGDGALTADA